MSTTRTAHRRESWAIPALVALAIGALLASWRTDRRLPTSDEWQIVGLLSVVAVLGTVLAWHFMPADAQSKPPWSVHTIWLMPAALLLPPVGFLPLVAFSLVLGLARRSHALPVRLMVSSITAFTTAELHWAAQLIDNVLLAGLVGIIALYVTGVLCAVLAISVFAAPVGASLWMDYRWSFVQLGCSFAGLVTTMAMLYDHWAALTALALVLMAEFTLNWPELDRHARIDAKTGLPNARHWDERSRELIDAARAHHVPVAVAMIDIDHFKRVNDVHGHLVGDEVLQSIAATLRSQVNPGDVLGRFGGEEFVVTLFGLRDTDAAAQVAERIRAAVATQVHSSRARLAPDSRRRPATFSITCTVGLASSEVHGHDLMALLAAADESLVAGKAAGRDRVQVG